MVGWALWVEKMGAGSLSPLLGPSLTLCRNLGARTSQLREGESTSSTAHHPLPCWACLLAEALGIPLHPPVHGGPTFLVPTLLLPHRGHQWLLLARLHPLSASVLAPALGAGARGTWTGCC